MPVITAHARARKRWPSWRAASPVIHWLSPLASAVRPSRLAATFIRTHGPPARHPRNEAGVELARLALHEPELDGDARLAQPARAVRAPADSDRPLRRRRARRRRRSAHRCTAACGPCGCTARASRRPSRRADRARAPSRRRARSPRHAAVAGARVEAFADRRPVLDEHAADAGIGRGRVEPARRRASARVMYARSASEYSAWQERPAGSHTADVNRVSAS